jgi:hypothetical protein
MRFNDYINEKQKFNTTTNPKKLSDDDLMDFMGWMENMHDPNPDNKDQMKSAMKAGQKEMKRRGFKNESYVNEAADTLSQKALDKLIKAVKDNISVVRSEVAAVKNKRWHDTFIEKIDTATNELNRLA